MSTHNIDFYKEISGNDFLIVTVCTGYNTLVQRIRCHGKYANYNGCIVI